MQTWSALLGRESALICLAASLVGHKSGRLCSDLLSEYVLGGYMLGLIGLGRNVLGFARYVLAQTRSNLHDMTCLTCTCSDVLGLSGLGRNVLGGHAILLGLLGYELPRPSRTLAFSAFSVEIFLGLVGRESS